MMEDDARGVTSTTSEYLESVKDDKKKWIEKMIKSAKKYHKICPYYDKKTANCFIKQLKNIKVSKCDRDGKFDGCAVFTGYLEERYEWYVSSGVLLPVDFRDITSIF